MFGGLAAAGSDTVIFAAIDGSVTFFDVETGRVAGQFARCPTGPEHLRINACAVDADGRVLLADARNRCVRHFAPDGLPLGRFGRRATPGIETQDEAGVLDEPCAIEPLPDGFLVACGGLEVEHGVQLFDFNGDYRRSFAHPEAAWLRAQGLARVGEEFWVAETEGGVIHRLGADGGHQGRIEFPEELAAPFRLRFDGYDGVLALFAPVAEELQQVLGVGRLDLDGNFEEWAVAAGEQEGSVYCPFDLAMLPDGRFVVADLPLGAPPDVRLQLYSADGRLLATLFEDVLDLNRALREWFTALLAADEDSPRSFYEKARVHHYYSGGGADQLERAGDLYRAALRLDPGYLMARLGLGWLLQRGLADPDAAETEYRDAIEKGGDEGDLMSLVAECRRDRGDLDGAIEILQATLEGPRPPEEYHRRLEDLGTYYLKRAGEAP